MRVRRVLVTCLAGAVGAVALPAGAMAMPAAPGAVAMRVPAAPSATKPVLAPSLQQLRAEINSRWPGRSRSSDGWLGDMYHQASTSEHNPVGHPRGPAFGTPGSVHALDITASGVDTGVIISALLRDSRVWYVIHNRTIYSRTYGFAPRPYFGNPHTTHIHISLRADDQASAVGVENDTRPWLGGASAPVGQAGQASVTGNQVKALQLALINRGFKIQAGVTGLYGPQTRAAVAAFQRSQGWTGSGADGVAGAETLRRLGLGAGAGASFVQVSNPAPPPSAPPAAPAAAPPVAPGGYAMGVSGAHIRALQQALIRAGFGIAQGATGTFGPQTKAAVAAFQRSQGWSGALADGIPGPRTLQRLGASAPAPAAPAAPAAVVSGTYAIGAQGQHIKALQDALIRRGFAIQAGATGRFGVQTQAAVAAFQRSKGWSGAKADGIPGRGTLAALGLS